MYNYDFLENNEQIIKEKVNGIVDINDDTYNFSIVITNKNILLFKDVSKNSPLGARGVFLPEDYVLKASIPLNNLDYTIEDNNTIINYENNEIVLYDVNIQEFV